MLPPIKLGRSSPEWDQIVSGQCLVLFHKSPESRRVPVQIKNLKRRFDPVWETGDAYIRDARGSPKAPEGTSGEIYFSFCIWRKLLRNSI